MDRRIQKTRHAIITTYKQMLMETNHSKLTITELSERANIDRKTFYLHYNSLDDILNEIIENEMEQLEKEINLTAFHSIDTQYIIECLNNCVLKDVSFYQALSKRPDFTIFAEKIKELLTRKTIESLSPSLTLSEKELTFYCKFFIAGLTDIYIDWFRNNNQLTLEEVGKLTSKVISEGIHVLT